MILQNETDARKKLWPAPVRRWFCRGFVMSPRAPSTADVPPLPTHLPVALSMVVNGSPFFLPRRLRVAVQESVPLGEVFPRPSFGSRVIWRSPRLPKEPGVRLN